MLKQSIGKLEKEQTALNPKITSLEQKIEETEA